MNSIASTTSVDGHLPGMAERAVQSQFCGTASYCAWTTATVGLEAPVAISLRARIEQAAGRRFCVFDTQSRPTMPPLP